MIDLSMPLTAARLAIAGLLMAGAVHKFRDFAGLRNAMASYLSVTPFQGPRVVTTLAIAIAVAEGLAALAIASSRTLPYTVYGAVFGVAIFLLYAGAMLLNIVRGNTIADCGCVFGSQQKQAVGPALVVRNLVLAAIASSVAIPVRPTALDWMGIVCFAVLVLLLYAIWNEMDANRSIARDF